MKRLLMLIVRILLYLILFYLTFSILKILTQGNKSFEITAKSAQNDKVAFKLPPRRQKRSKPLPFCSGLYNGDLKTINLAEKYMKINEKIGLLNKDYIKMAANCDDFIRSRRYFTISSPEEKRFPIAYSIVAYKNVEQVERLLRSIYMPQNYYCIHYDAKSSTDFKMALDNIAKCFDNVVISRKITPVHWGTSEVLLAEIYCLETLLKYKSWKYFINLTGQEMPLLSNRQLVRVLKAYNGANDIEGTIKNRNTDRFEYVHIRNQITSQRKSAPPHNLTIVKGAIHIVAYRGFIEFAVHDQRAKDLLQWLADTGIPDESFFSTLNHNPQLGAPGAYTGIPETDPVKKPFLARFKNWRSGMFHSGPCGGEWLRDVCVLGVRDLQKLPSRRELFVNKFDLYKNYLALDCAEERIYNQTIDSFRANFTFDVEYYKNLSFVRNQVFI